MAPLLPWAGVSWDCCDQKPLKVRGDEFCEATPRLGAAFSPGGTGARSDLETALTPRVQLGEAVHYLPILFIDQLSNRVRDLMVSSQGSLTMKIGRAHV